MTEERRYGDQEVAEILEAAARLGTPEGRALSPASGISLQELQAIGGEVGIAPERIAEAAAALDLRQGVAPRRKQMGLPVAVGRVVDLPRAPSDHEWEALVAELRQTFGAHGKDRSSGGLRAWRNGNLHAYVEPADGGYRLRLGTTNANGLGMGQMGIGALIASLALLVFFFLSGELDEGARTAALVALMGLVALGANALRLPRWADEREQQMEHVALRARALIRPDPVPMALGDGGTG